LLCWGAKKLLLLRQHLLNTWLLPVVVAAVI
jgi:hypothetical protein